MKITGIQLERFLSFEQLTWEQLDPGLNVIVGPNGAGKTNLVHALRAVVDALDSGDGVRTRPLARDQWEDAAYQSPVTRREDFKIAVDLCFTHEWEKKLIHAFLCAVLTDREEIQRVLAGGQPPVSVTQEGAERLADVLLHEIRIEDVEWLYRGRLVVAYEGDHRWHTSYESLPGEPVPFRWEFEGSSTHGLLGPAADPQAGITFLFEAWRTGLPPEDQSSLDHFLGDTSEAPPAINLMHVLSGASRPINLYAKRPGSGPLSSHKLLESLAGVTLDTNRAYDGRALFRQIFGQALVFTDNVRRSPQLSLPVGAIVSPAPAELSSGEGLALELFRLKNGDRTARARYRAVQDAFTALTDRSFAVGIRTWKGERTAEGNSAGSGPEAPQLPLGIRVESAGREVPLAFAGAGIAEALYLSTVLEGVEDRVVLLDEPASNLHRDIQSVLLRRVEAAASHSQFLVISHSAAFVPSDIRQISRFYLEDGATGRAATDQAGEDFQKLSDVFRRFARARELLFSRAVILVEGEADVVAFGTWLEADLRDWDVQLYGVESDTSLANHILLLRSFRIPWAVVCDGKAIGDQNDCRMALQLRRAGVAGPNVDAMKRLDFKQRRDELEQFGVFTTATSATDELEGLSPFKNHMAEAKNAVSDKRGENKVRIARFVVDKEPTCPAKVRTTFVQAEEFLRSCSPSYEEHLPAQ